MRVGELDDSVGREFASRRDAMAVTVARLGERMAEPAIPAVTPAVLLSDSVHISAEARAAQFTKAPGGLALPPFPSPVELVAVLRDVASNSGPTQAAAVERLGELVRLLAQSFPAPAAAAGPQQSDAIAGQLVRALLKTPAAPGASGARPGDVTALVRQLIAAFPATGAGAGSGVSATPFERAAVAVLMALTRAGAGERGGSAVPRAAAQDGSLPPALLGFFGAVPPVVRRTRRHRQDDDHNFDEEPVDDELTEDSYRSSPRRR